jgi:hypothetical protein
VKGPRQKRGDQRVEHAVDGERGNAGHRRRKEERANRRGHRHPLGAISGRGRGRRTVSGDTATANAITANAAPNTA